MIKSTSLKPVIQTLFFGKIPQWSLYSTPQNLLDHHQIPSSSRPQVLVVLSTGIVPMDTVFSLNSTPMVLDTLVASVHHFSLPSSLATTTICSNGPSQSTSTLESMINWIHWTHGRKQFSLIKTRPTRSPQSQQKQELRQSSSTSLLLTLNSLAKLKVF